MTIPAIGSTRTRRGWWQTSRSGYADIRPKIGNSGRVLSGGLCPDDKSANSRVFQFGEASSELVDRALDVGASKIGMPSQYTTVDGWTGDVMKALPAELALKKPSSYQTWSVAISRASCVRVGGSASLQVQRHVNSQVIKSRWHGTEDQGTGPGRPTGTVRSARRRSS
jgi:hypothetical protein